MQAIEIATAGLFGTKFHAISGATRDSENRNNRIRPELIRVVPRGRKHERLGEFSPEWRLRTRLADGMAADTPAVIKDCRQEWQKGQSGLIEAAAESRLQFPNPVALIAGRPGNCSDNHAAGVRRLGLKTTLRFLGYVEEVPDLLCAVGDSPSHSNTEVLAAR